MYSPISTINFRSSTEVQLSIVAMLEIEIGEMNQVVKFMCHVQVWNSLNCSVTRMLVAQSNGLDTEIRAKHA